MNIRRSKLLRRKSLLGRLLRLPFKLIPAKMVLPIMSGPLKGQKWVKGSHNLTVLLGTYERKQSREFFKRAQRADVLWDLGAHVGYYSLLFKTARPSGRVIAFEPFQPNVALYHAHMKMNGITDFVLFQEAVSNKPGVLRFDSGRTSVAGKISDAGREEVQVARLSEYCANGTIPAPNMIKMDIEGEELKVLEDISPLLKEVKPDLFLSTHGKPVHDGCVSLLESLGYHLVPLDVSSLAESRELLAFEGNRGLT